MEAFLAGNWLWCVSHLLICLCSIFSNRQFVFRIRHSGGWFGAGLIFVCPCPSCARKTWTAFCLHPWGGKFAFCHSGGRLSDRSSANLWGPLRRPILVSSIHLHPHLHHPQPHPRPSASSIRSQIWRSNRLPSFTSTNVSSSTSDGTANPRRTVIVKIASTWWYYTSCA